MLSYVPVIPERQNIGTGYNKGMLMLLALKSASATIMAQSLRIRAIKYSNV